MIIAVPALNKTCCCTKCSPLCNICGDLLHRFGVVSAHGNQELFHRAPRVSRRDLWRTLHGCRVGEPPAAWRRTSRGSARAFAQPPQDDGQRTHSQPGSLLGHRQPRSHHPGAQGSVPRDTPSSQLIRQASPVRQSSWLLLGREPDANCGPITARFFERERQQLIKLDL